MKSGGWYVRDGAAIDIVGTFILSYIDKLWEHTPAIRTYVLTVPLKRKSNLG